MLEHTDSFHHEDQQFLGKMFGPPNVPTATAEPSVPDLRVLYENRLTALGINQTAALALLDMESRTLQGILDGTQKRIDFIMLKRFAFFLNVSVDLVVQLLLKKLEITFKDELDTYRIRLFITQNFDLAALYNSGFLINTTDFNYINDRLVSYFGYETIFEYDKEKSGAALSSSLKRTPKDKLTKTFWLKSARRKLGKINNYYEYDRAKLLAYIPKLRWHSMNARNGLFQAIRDLFKLGVTVIFEPYLDNIYVRGATFVINEKPAIVLTNYTRFYPTLWFALLHEIHHVLFDWNTLRDETFHASGVFDLFSKEEVEADEFARKCLVPDELMNEVKPFISNPTFVKEYAKANYIHPSIIYIFYCYDKQESDKKVWGRFNDQIPDVSIALEALNNNPWQNRKSINEATQQLQEEVFNGL